MSPKLRPIPPETSWIERRELSAVEIAERARTRSERFRASLGWALVEHASTLEKLAK